MATAAVREKTLVDNILSVFLWGVVVIIGGIVVEWVVMTKWYPHQGAHHSLNLMNAELSYLEGSALLKTDYGNVILAHLLKANAAFYQFVSQTLHVEKGLLFIADQRLAQTSFNTFSMLHPREYAISMLNMVHVMSLRMIIVILSLPIYLLVMCWAVNKGLTNRSIRRHQVQEESGFLYHHAKRYKTKMIVLPVIIYLAWPTELSPLLVFAPFAVLYGIAWLVMASKLKKNW